MLKCFRGEDEFQQRRLSSAGAAVRTKAEFHRGADSRSRLLCAVVQPRALWPRAVAAMKPRSRVSELTQKRSDACRHLSIAGTLQSGAVLAGGVRLSLQVSENMATGQQIHGYIGVPLIVAAYVI